MDFVSAAQRSVRGCWRLGWRWFQRFFRLVENALAEALAQAVAGFLEIVWAENADHVI